MSLNTVIGKKIDQTQAFLENGTRIPMSRIFVGENFVTQLKTTEKEGYNAVQVAFGTKRVTTKPLQGHIKKSGLTTTPRFFKEIKSDKVAEFELGSTIKVDEVLSAGDIVDVIGISKGKGFAGVVKRHHFKGGPKTHGQSDRHRAPGSIGQSTTPGRVYKGKRMAGRMGNERVTLKNLLVMDIVDGTLFLKGLIPGPKGTLVTVVKKGEKKKFIPLYSDKVEEVVIDEAKVEEVGLSIEEQEALRVEVEAQKEAEELAEKEAAQITPPADATPEEKESKEEKAVSAPAEEVSNVAEEQTAEVVEEKTEEEAK